MSFNLTQQQLESMSNFELNVVAANHFYDCGNLTTSPSKDDIGSAWVLCNGKLENTNYDPCTSWLDCGELIDELSAVTGSTIEFDDDIFIFHYRRNKTVVKCKNTKRAVTIVYILVKQLQK